MNDKKIMVYLLKKEVISMTEKTSVKVPAHILRRNFYIARRRKGLSRRELSEQVGLQAAQLYNFEKGLSWINDPCKIMLANILNESVYHLFFEELENTESKRRKLQPAVSKMKYIEIFTK